MSATSSRTLLQLAARAPRAVVRRPASRRTVATVQLSRPKKSPLLPILGTIGATAAVATYVARTLHHESQTMDRMFAQKNTPEVEARRKQQLLTETEGDPRRSLFNILGWK